jgi:hypothetical protein
LNFQKLYETKWEAKKALFICLSKSNKNPWRDELSVYKCNDCKGFHLSSKNTDYTPTVLRDKYYYEIQKEKWGNWLHNYAKNGAVINKKNKKYST